MYRYKELSDAIVERAVLDYKKALNRKDNSIIHGFVPCCMTE